MIIIERKEWCLQVDCTTCGSKLEINSDDVVFWNNQRIDESGYYVICPVCGGQINLTSLPEVIKDKAVDRYKAKQ